MAADWFTPTAVANQALSAAGVPITLQDIQDGSDQSRICLQFYSECLRQLLRGAHWDFARREVDLVLLADATGLTANVGTRVPGSRFIYEYALPQNCAKVRWIPANPLINPPVPADNIVPPDSDAPLTTGQPIPPNLGQQNVPAPWMLTSDVNYIPDGASNEQPGVSPVGRTVILTNVKQARCVYTYDALYPNTWDHQFRAALVSYLASEIALPMHVRRGKENFGLQMMDRLVKITQEKVKEARISNGNEGWSSSDLSVDWMRIRNTGGWWGPWGSGLAGAGAWGGYLFGGVDAIGFSGNSSAY